MNNDVVMRPAKIMALFHVTSERYRVEGTSAEFISNILLRTQSERRAFWNHVYYDLARSQVPVSRIIGNLKIHTL
jgi:hypothetical protein